MLYVLGLAAVFVVGLYLDHARAKRNASLLWEELEANAARGVEVVRDLQAKRRVNELWSDLKARVHDATGPRS